MTNYLKISEFAKLTGISRENLIFYDKEGLLTPEHKGKNGYRYYTKSQLSQAYMVFILRRLEIPIKEIKLYCNQQSNQQLTDLFNNKRHEIDKRISELENARSVMDFYTNNLNETKNALINTVQLKQYSEKKIFIGPLLSEKLNQNYDLANLEFYKYCHRNNISLMSPFGIILDRNKSGSKSHYPIKQCYFQVAQNYNASKLEGLYAVIYVLGNKKNIDSPIGKLLSYIKEKHLDITSDIYVDYPRSELTNNNTSEFLTRIMIRIEKKFES